MKTLKLTALILILSLLFSLAACKRSGTDTDETTTQESNAETSSPEKKNDIRDYITEIEVPYDKAAAPCLYGDNIFFAASSVPQTDTLTSNNLLLMHNISTDETELITKLPETHTIEFISANDRWLVWTVLVPPGGLSKMYLMDLVNGGTKEIRPEESDSFYHVHPYVVGDSIYWLEEQYAIETMNIRSVIKYDCNTGARVEILSLYDESSSVNDFFLNEGHLLWFSYISGKQYYFLHNINEHKTISVETKNEKINSAIYAGGLIFSTEIAGTDENTEVVPCIIDVQKKEYLSDDEDENAVPSFGLKAVSGSFVYVDTGLTVSFNKLEKTNLSIISRLPERTQGQVYPADGSRFITVQSSQIAERENFGVRPYTQKLFIFDFSKLAEQK